MSEPQPAVQQRSLAIRREADSVRAFLTAPAMTSQLRAALPRHLTPERLVRVAVTAIQTNPKLLECDRQSLFAAVMTCAQLGLEPDGVLGQAYLVPFKGKVVFIPGYKGLISLARNSGEVVSIAAKEVYAKDHFVYQFGLEEKLEHVPSRDADRGEIIYVYAIARFKDGGHHWDVMTVAEVEKIRNGSSGWQAYAAKKTSESPWASNFAEMAKKTAIRRIAKYLPMNVQKAAALADAYDRGRHGSLDATGDVVIEEPSALEPGEPETAPIGALDAFAADGDAEADKQRQAAAQAEMEARAGERGTSAQEPAAGDAPQAIVPQVAPAASAIGLTSGQVAELGKLALRLRIDEKELTERLGRPLVQLRTGIQRDMQVCDTAKELEAWAVGVIRS